MYTYIYIYTQLLGIYVFWTQVHLTSVGVGIAFHTFPLPFECGVLLSNSTFPYPFPWSYHLLPPAIEETYGEVAPSDAAKPRALVPCRRP